MTSTKECQNPHSKLVRHLLNRLTILSNEYQRVNIELKSTQKEFKQSLDNAIFQCSELKKLACASEEKLNHFQKNVENINNITEGFNRNIENLQNKCKYIIAESKQLFNDYNIEKTNLKQFYHKTINDLKSFAIQNNDPDIIRKCEKIVNENNKNYEKKILYISKCENVLSTFFQLLFGRENVLHFNQYEWQPPGKSKEITGSIGKEIRDRMGITLREAFSHIHIRKPLDKETFLVQYLLNEARNEEIIKEKLERFENK